MAHFLSLFSISKTLMSRNSYDAKNNKLHEVTDNTANMSSKPDMHLQCVQLCMCNAAGLTVCFWLTHSKLSLVCRGTVQCVSITAPRSLPHTPTHTHKQTFASLHATNLECEQANTHKQMHLRDTISTYCVC